MMMIMIVVMMVVIVGILGNVMIVMLVLFHASLLAGFLRFAFEQLANCRIFLLLFDLFHFERNAEPLRKIAFSNS